MNIEAFVVFLVFLSVWGGVWVLLPKRSDAPKRHVTSSRNGYGRGWDR